MYRGGWSVGQKIVLKIVHIIKNKRDVLPIGLPLTPLGCVVNLQLAIASKFDKNFGRKRSHMARRAVPCVSLMIAFRL
jgi:hypothetical protein